MKNTDFSKYASYFDDGQFWDKVKKVAKKVGIKLVYVALTLYYAVKMSDLTAKDKALVLGVLGYFILPVDLIPDFIPVLGFTDDWAALLFVFYKISSSVTPEVKALAKSKLHEWFGDFADSDIVIEKQPTEDDADEQ